MKTVSVEIQGLSPLLMSRYPLEPIENLAKKSDEERAEIAAYRDASTKMLYIPGTAIQRCFIGGAAYSKGKGRSTLAKFASAGIFVNPLVCSLKVKDYAIDRQSAVNPMTKGRVIVVRPRLDEWKVSFEISYNDTLFDAKQLRKIVDDAGALVGLLSFRPEKKGPFGRFVVVSWKEV